MKKKKGNAILEFMIIAPIAMLMFWFSVQFITYIIYVNNNYQAAIDASKFVAQYMRGSNLNTSVPNNAAFKTKVESIVQQTIANNSLNKMNDNGGTFNVIIEPNNTACPFNTMADETICITSDQENFTVYIKSEYKLLTGNHSIINGFNTGSGYTIEILGSGISQRQVTSQFIYS